MKTIHPLILGFASFLFTTAAGGQLVQIGLPDPHYCDKIQVQPNLILTNAAAIAGRIIDGSGAPLENSAVELRTWISATKQTRLQLTSTDKDGYFHLDTISPGKYRLLASVTRLFIQPRTLGCPKEKACDLQIVLQPTPTDMLDSRCPIR